MTPRVESVLLSDREAEILKLLVAGMLKKQIAGRLELSIHTVGTYIRRIYEKTGGEHPVGCRCGGCP
jgi:DNA-binding CsgD family transcriptional regulator